MADRGTVVESDLAILEAPIVFRGRDGKQYKIRQLDSAYAVKNLRSLRAIHKLIPYVGVDSDFFQQDAEIGNAEFYRWNLSMAVEFEGKPVGFLTTFIRDFSDRHPYRSAYIHRMSIAKAHQRNRIGAQLVATALSLYFEAMPWLLTVTVQTNDEPQNSGVLSFYRRCGFHDRYRVQYSSKLDTLLDFERNNSNGPGSLFGDFGDLVIASRPPVRNRLPNAFGNPSELECANVFFGTTSNEKFAQYKNILRSYGLRLQRLRHSISLTEPQIDNAGPNAESALVAGPLKLFSRFAAKNTSFPVMVEDTMLFIEHFNSDFATNPILPGPDTKRWWKALGSDGLLRVLGSSAYRAAKYVCQVGLNYGPGKYQYFRHEQQGTISDSVRIALSSETNFPFTNATFFHSIFIPDGSPRTIAEMDSNELLKYDYRRACIAKAVPMLEHYGARDPQLVLFGSL